HSAREIATDREPQTESLLRLGERAIELNERLEHILAPTLRESPPRGPAADLHAVMFVGTRRKRDPTTGWRIADRVREQVEQYLTSLLAVRDDRQRARCGNVLTRQRLRRGVWRYERIELGEERLDGYSHQCVAHVATLDA